MSPIEDLKVLISRLNWDELDQIPEIINADKCRRLKSQLTNGTKVITLLPGFSGLAGVVCEFIKFKTTSNGTETANFGKDGNIKWIIEVKELASYIKII